VLKVLPEKNRLVVEGVNFIKPGTPAEPAEERQGRHRATRGAAARFERSTGLSRVQRGDPDRAPGARGRAEGADCRKCEGVVDK
jgi:ribosomal protein L24